MQLGSQNLTYKCFTVSPGNAFILGSKGQRPRSWVTKTVPAWVFALLWVLDSSSVVLLTLDKRVGVSLGEVVQQRRVGVNLVTMCRLRTQHLLSFSLAQRLLQRLDEVVDWVLHVHAVPTRSQSTGIQRCDDSVAVHAVKPSIHGAV